LPGDSVDVSVVIPTFRREREVVMAVGSALAQEGVRVDVLVLDDSPDGSARRGVLQVNDSRVRYRQRPVPSGGKPAIVRNEGAAAVHGRYLHFLDDDDQLLPGSLRALTAALDAHPAVGVAIGKVVPFGSRPEILEANRRWAETAARLAARTAHSRWRAAASLLFRQAMLINSACLIRRELVAAVGGYDPAVPTYEDIEFYTRAIARYGHVFVDHPVLHRRTGEPCLSGDLPTAAPIEECYRMMFRKYCADYGLARAYALRVFAKVPGLI